MTAPTAATVATEAPTDDEQPDMSIEFVMPQEPELFKFINETPLVQSLLYDINLLPEQITSWKHWRYMLDVCSHMESAFEEATNAATKAQSPPAVPGGELPPLPEPLVIVRDTDDEPEDGGWIVDCDCEGPLSYSLKAGEALYTAEQVYEVVRADRRNHAPLPAIRMAVEALDRLIGITWGHGATTPDGCFTDDPTEKRARAALAALRTEVRMQESDTASVDLAQAPAQGAKVPAPQQPCWLVEKRENGSSVAFLGHALGSYEWMPTTDKATRFVRREDADGVAGCFEFEDVIVAEHIWG